jgi:hypothetical protein
MKAKCPEQLLWRHAKYILMHREDMTDAKNARRWMQFDAKSRIRPYSKMNLGRSNKDRNGIDKRKGRNMCFSKNKMKDGHYVLNLNEKGEVLSEFDKEIGAEDQLPVDNPKFDSVQSVSNS